MCSLSLSLSGGRVSITLDIREILSSKVFSGLKGTKEMRWRARLAKVVRLVGACEQLACFITRLSLIAPSRIEPVPTRAKVTEIHLDTLPPLDHMELEYFWDGRGLHQDIWGNSSSRLSTTLEIRKPRHSGLRRSTH